MVTMMTNNDESVTAARDPRNNPLAAYESRRRDRVHQLNVWLMSQAKNAAGKNDDDISCDDTMSDTDNNNNDGMLHLNILSSLFGSRRHGRTSSAQNPPPELKPHPDDLFFKSCRDLADLIDFTVDLSSDESEESMDTTN